MSGIEEEKSVHCGYITVGVSLWVCLYTCMRVCMSSCVRDPAVRSHMFVQSGQGGCVCSWVWYRLIRVWMGI